MIIIKTSLLSSSSSSSSSREHDSCPQFLLELLSTLQLLQLLQLLFLLLSYFVLRVPLSPSAATLTSTSTCLRRHGWVPQHQRDVATLSNRPACHLFGCAAGRACADVDGVGRGRCGALCLTPHSKPTSRLMQNTRADMPTWGFGHSEGMSTDPPLPPSLSFPSEVATVFIIFGKIK